MSPQPLDLSGFVEHIDRRDWMPALRMLTQAVSLIANQDEHKLLTVAPWLCEALFPIFSRNNQCLFLAAYSGHTARSEFLTIAEEWLGSPSEANEFECFATHDSLIGKWRKILSTKQRFDGSHHSVFLRSVELRLATLRWISQPPQEEQTRRKTLVSILRGYQELFSTRELWNESVIRRWQTDGRLRPAAYFHLSPATAEDVDFAINHLRTHYLDPAVAFLVDTLQLACSEKDLQERYSITEDVLAWKPGSTFLLFAKSGKKLEGVLGLLRVTPVKCASNSDDNVDRSLRQPTAGAFYPDPRWGAHYAISSDFQLALRHAWQVNRLDHTLDFADYRWSLSLFGEEEIDQRYLCRSPLLFHPLDGRSGTLALAAALRSAKEGVPLDRFTLSSAQFNEQDVELRDPELKTIEQLSSKDRTAIQQCRTCIVAKGQSSLLTIQSLKPKEAFNWSAAYLEMSSDGVITNRLRQHQLEEAREWFRERCFVPSNAGPDEQFGAYIRNVLTELIPDPQSPEKVRTKTISPKDNPSEYHDFVMAHFPTREDGDSVKYDPIIIEADSGIGKSTWLRFAQINMLQNDDHRLVFVAEQLDAWLEHKTMESFLTFLKGELPKFRELDEAYLKRKILKGEAVFLLDALDQSSSDRVQLATTLNLLRNCPCFVTMRPDTQHNLLWKPQRDFVSTGLYRLEPFTLVDARDYLGGDADKVFNLLPKTDQEKGGILTIPFMLYNIRKLLQTGELAKKDLRNRYTLFWRLIASDEEDRKGAIFDNVKKKQQELEMIAAQLANVDLEMVDRTRTQMFEVGFWQTSLHHSFETAITERSQPPVMEFHEFCSQLLGGKPGVAQKFITAINIITSKSLVESTSQTRSLLWRHRSYVEFLSGCRLAELFHSPNEQDRNRGLEVVRDIASVFDKQGNIRSKNLRRDWEWTLRFALAHEASTHVQKRGDCGWSLAETLIAYGDPYVVYDAIVEDGLEVSRDLEDVVRWLVHWTWYIEDYSDAYTEKTADGEWEVPPKLNERLAELLVPMFMRPYRNGPALPAAWALLEEHSKSDDAHYNSAQRWFFSDLTSDEALQRSVEAWLPDAFVEIPPKNWPQENAQGFRDLKDGSYSFQFRSADSQTKQRVNAFSMTRYTLSNEEYEWMDPTHRHIRSRFSDDEDQPAVNVSWYMARLYGVWLTGNLRKGDPDSYGEFRLPNEVEIEFAIRGGSKGEYPTNHLGEADENWKRFNSIMHGVGKPMGKLFELKSDDAKAEDYMNGFGVVHPVGDVWIWAQNRRDDIGDIGKVASLDNPLLIGQRSTRGGASFGDESRLRKSLRFRFDRPSYLGFDIGFRLMCILR